MDVDRDLTDRLLAADDELVDVDRERFHLDLSEIIDEATRIVSLVDTKGTASELLVALSGSIAHMTSHWERLARDTDWSDAYAELIKTSRAVNEDDLSWWQRLRQAR